MASGGSRTFNGAFRENNATATISKIPFSPTRLELINRQQSRKGVKTDQMEGDEFLAEETGSISFQNGIVLNSSGFVVTHGWFAGSGHLVYFTAWG